jgi:hypothetical protein
MAEANSKHALDMAQKLSHQLRSAEDRIAELEAEVQLYQWKSDRAEQWLHKVYTEIEDRFLQQADGRQGVTGALNGLRDVGRKGFALNVPPLNGEPNRGNVTADGSARSKT